MIFEWLGLTEPENGRKEPVALPAWAPAVVAAAGAVLAGLVGGLILLAVRALLG